MPETTTLDPVVLTAEITAAYVARNHVAASRAAGLARGWTLPLGTRVRVTVLATGRHVGVTINDRGPHLRLHRLIDLSLGAARRLKITRRGLATVRVSLL